jgi:ABC-type transport system substrate-binding protein
MKQITEKQIVDPYTIRFKTAAPYPLMPNDMGTILIVSSRAAKGATTEDFNSGKATIGTGRFRFVRWQKGNRIELQRFDGYWGPKAPWEHVTLRIITSDPTRVASLLSREVGAIEQVPTADLARISKQPDLSVYRIVSHRIMYLHVDSNRDVSPFVTDKAGKPLPKNPLKDVRVRRAISKAINRQALVDRVMEGAARPSGQLMPEGMFGWSPTLKPDAYDPDGAKKLLAEAGYPDGFSLTLHGPNDRYVNDDQIAQAIAQMLSRVGIATRVETMPSSVYFSRANKLEFSLMLVGWGSDTAEASSPLKALLATFSKEKGMGQANRGRYSSAKMDALLAQALATVDDAKREKLLAEAGYPDGFALTLHGPNDRYVNDDQIAQAIAQMLSRVGIATREETVPYSDYITRANNHEISQKLVGWGSDTAEASSPLKALLATFSKEKGMGQANRGRYSSAKMDALLAQALATVDDARREKLLQDATAVAMADVGIVPLYHQENVWATRKGIVYTPRADERTFAFEFRPQ